MKTMICSGIMRLQFNWFFVFVIGFYISFGTSILQKNLEGENIIQLVSESVQGTTAKLPCNITPPVQGDRIALVIWYKQGHPKPIYSFDTRQSKFEKGAHWVEEYFGGRAHFYADTNPAILSIESTRSSDTGIYRCRVDFQKSPTRNSEVQLKIIIPPEKLVILDDTGNHIPHYILGPYNEGSSINITCVSTGGSPLPNVTWWNENTLLDGTSNLLSERRVSNVLRLSKLERRHLHMVFTCQATNNKLIAPISSSITLDLNLKPLWVKLQGENRPLSAGTSYQLPCIVIGSRPAPTVTWWKGSTAMRNTHEITSSDGNMTTSVLTFTPTIDDRGKFLSCRAEQTLIPESGIEDGWKLDIYHVPVVSLEFGTNSNNTIREGADVYFECNIKSNPWVYRVIWRHNGDVLDNNQAEGIILANQSLVLQSVTRARSGLYTCVGSNREGDGESNPIQLDVQFAPVCRLGQKTIYSLGRQETAKVVCEVETNPSNVSFVWRFNTSTIESVDIPASQFTVDGSRSIVQYTPITEHDYGTLLCWASNDVGNQVDPCIFHIIPAGEPDPLSECIVLNQTANSFRIECIEGFDGGLEQDFIMKVFINGTTRNPRVYKSKIPQFEVFGLTPGMTYNVYLVAQNKKGTSNSTILQIYTLKDPEKQTAYNADLSMPYSPVIEDIRRFLIILLGFVGMIFLVALTIVVVVRIRGSSGRDRDNFSHHYNRDNLNMEQNFNRHAHRVNSSDSMDRNPDIIPQDDRDDDDDEWTINVHPSSYATTALAEQDAGVTSTYDHLPYRTREEAHLQQRGHEEIPCSHHQLPQYIKTYNTLIPTTKIHYTSPQQKTSLTYAELSLPVQNIPAQQLPYCSATLQRPMHYELKRVEPNICAQMDLAHHSMYRADPTTIPSSRHSELVTFPSKPFVFSNFQTTGTNPKLAIPSQSGCHPKVTETTLLKEADIKNEILDVQIVKPPEEAEGSHSEMGQRVPMKGNKGNKNHATRF